MSDFPEKTVNIRIYEFEREWLRANFGGPTQVAVRNLRKALGCRHLERDFFSCSLVNADSRETRRGVGFTCKECGYTIILPAEEYQIIETKGMKGGEK
jgi:hypothetical protein